MTFAISSMTSNIFPLGMGRSVLTGRRRGVTPPPASPVPLPLQGRQKTAETAERRAARLEKKRQYGLAHREERIAYMQAYNEAHRQERREYQRAYDAAHKAEINARRRARRAAKKRKEKEHGQ